MQTPFPGTQSPASGVSVARGSLIRSAGIVCRGVLTFHFDADDLGDGKTYFSSNSYRPR
jgi:hypothetical protein